MNFNSIIFILFLGIVLVAYHALPRAYAKYVILASSCAFYGWWDYRFLALFLCAAAVNYFAARLCSPKGGGNGRGYVLLFCLIFNIGLLSVFKYMNFFGESFSAVLSSLGLHLGYRHINIILPVGLSFITFGMISYVVDVYKGKVLPEKDFVVFSSYVLFFPKLLAGPIERAGDFFPQIRQKQPVSKDLVTEGLWLILWGYFLKVFVADNLSNVVDSIYSNYKSVSGADVVICSYAYAYQIFGDFAGYSYIAIGVSKLFGISLQDNFRFPYFSESPSEFWRNWHISLSTWIRDYVYIPLGGNRGSRIFVYRNLLIATTLAGLWHGADWPYMLWGIYQGILLVCFNLFSRKPPAASTFSMKTVARVFLMFNLTCLGWMIFRTPDMDVLITMMNHAFFDVAPLTPRTFYWGMCLLSFAGIPFVIQLLQFRSKSAIAAPFRTPITGVLWCTAMVFLLLVLGNWGTKQFIYMQF